MINNVNNVSIRTHGIGRNRPVVCKPTARTIFLEIFLTALLIGASYYVALRFVYPGYFAPLWPHHADFYMPASMASAGSIWKVLGLARPVGMLFYAAIGSLGTRGAMAAVIFITIANATLSLHIFRRIIDAPSGVIYYIFVMIYGLLLFSAPFFYIFYAQDAFAQLSYLFLLAGLYIHYYASRNHPRGATILMIVFSALAFLTKETYILTAIVLASNAVILAPRMMRTRAIAMMVSLGLGLSFAIGMSLLQKSMFLGQDQVATYTTDFSPVSIMHEWWRYAADAFAPLSIVAIVACAMLSFYRSTILGRKHLLLTASCVIAAVAAWIPNSTLPQHYFPGYSWSGAYVLLLPIVLPSTIVQTYRGVLISLALLLAIVPVNRTWNEFSSLGSEWVLKQEASQRRLLTVLSRLLKDLPQDLPQHILVSGLTLPFSPFDHPGSLYKEIGRRNIDFTVIDYRGTPRSPSGDTRYISPEHIDIIKFDRVWGFTDEGSLVFDKNLDQMSNTAREDRVLDFAFPMTSPEYLTQESGTSKESDSKEMQSLGLTWYNYGIMQKAIDCFKKSVMLYQQDPYTWFYLGNALSASGKLLEAKDAYTSAVKEDKGLVKNAYFESALLDIDRRLSRPGSRLQQ